MSRNRLLHGVERTRSLSRITFEKQLEKLLSELRELVRLTTFVSTASGTAGRCAISRSSSRQIGARSFALA